MAEGFLTRHEFLSSLVQEVPFDYSYLMDPIVKTLDHNLDTFFDNSALIAAEYVSVKNLPNKKIWDSRTNLDQVYSAYEGIQKAYLEDFVYSLDRYYKSMDDVLREVYKEHYVPKINQFSEQSAREYVLNLEVNDKYRLPKVYELIIGNETGRSEEDIHSLEI